MAAGASRRGAPECVRTSARAGDSLELLAVTSLEAWGRTLRAEDGREAVPLSLPYPITAT